MTYDELQALWTARDDRYAYFKEPLTRLQIDAIVRWRCAEAVDLDNILSCVEALEKAKAWQPPVTRRSPEVLDSPKWTKSGASHAMDFISGLTDTSTESPEVPPSGSGS
jgi:hypothetical protein